MADLGRVLAPLQTGWRWLPLSLACGLLPLLLAWPCGSWLHQPLTGLLLTPLVWAALLAGRTRVALAAVVCTFASHSLLAIALSATYGAEVAPLFQEGAAYWGKQQRWILSGHDPEYEVASWLPIHLQLLVACVVLAPLTLGLAIFVQGFYEVDLMNYYVGRLWAASELAPGALAFGWHPWSLCRGLCYLLLSVELVRWCCEALCGLAPPPRRARALRLGLACVFFALDCVIKFTCTEWVRGVLHASLVR